MEYEVKKSSHGTTHRIAICESCDWNDGYAGAGDSIERVARSAKSHTKKTGHSVVVESGNSFVYAAK